MQIPEEFSLSLPLGKYDYERSYYSGGRWRYVSDHKYSAKGSKLIHGWKSSYLTSDGFSPTIFSHVGIEGSAKFKGHSYEAFYRDTIDQSEDCASLASCLYSAIASSSVDAAPIHIGSGQINSLAAYNQKTRYTLRKGPVQSATNAADNRFLEKINNNSAELGAMVVELGETVSYFVGYATSFGQFAKAIYSGRWNKALKPLRISKKMWNARNKRIDQTIAGRWLEWSFAIKPAVSDCAKLAALWADPISALKALTYVTTASETFEGNGKSWLRMNTNTYQRVVDNSWQGKVRVSAHWAVADHEAVARSALGINAASPALWEGVPFSWLIDYVVNIGDYLAALSATAGLRFINGYRSYKIIQNTSLNYNNPTGYWTENRYSGKYKIEGYFREVITKFPKPHFSFVLSEISLNQISYVASLVSLLIPFKRRL